VPQEKKRACVAPGKSASEKISICQQSPRGFNKSKFHICNSSLQKVRVMKDLAISPSKGLGPLKFVVAVENLNFIKIQNTSSFFPVECHFFS
jgi:hypothetical protein